MVLRQAQTNKKHPDFESLRGSTLQKVTLDISELVLIMHEESICALVTLYTHLNEELGSMEKESKVSDSQIKATTAAKPLGSKPSATGIRKSSSNVIISMDLFASLSGFALEICNKNRTICDILVRGT
ncbi:hypothetical protein HPB51_020217 [Rhipicephalus microplus]|uniref:Uncharacterized protein n=1 Tax=Rhipicephalus microplus TaxID=6941 RepID=A0A9J6DPY6_RHIMP|nr:hypothetical protein HPB51_020217 [Rhipicephalus microplus]